MPSAIFAAATAAHIRKDARMQALRAYIPYTARSAQDALARAYPHGCYSAKIPSIFGWLTGQRFSRLTRGWVMRNGRPARFFISPEAEISVAAPARLHIQPMIFFATPSRWGHGMAVVIHCLMGPPAAENAASARAPVKRWLWFHVPLPIGFSILMRSLAAIATAYPRICFSATPRSPCTAQHALVVDRMPAAAPCAASPRPCRVMTLHDLLHQSEFPAHDAACLRENALFFHYAIYRKVCWH